MRRPRSDSARCLPSGLSDRRHGCRAINRRPWSLTRSTVRREDVRVAGLPVLSHRITAGSEFHRVPPARGGSNKSLARPTDISISWRAISHPVHQDLLTHVTAAGHPPGNSYVRAGLSPVYWDGPGQAGGHHRPQPPSHVRGHPAFHPAMAGRPGRPQRLLLTAAIGSRSAQIPTPRPTGASV
jgi:hypothetical protein